MWQGLPGEPSEYRWDNEMRSWINIAWADVLCWKHLHFCCGFYVCLPFKNQRPLLMIQLQGKFSKCPSFWQENNGSKLLYAWTVLLFAQKLMASFADWHIKCSSNQAIFPSAPPTIYIFSTLEFGGMIDMQKCIIDQPKKWWIETVTG